jgi:asparagine synthase (glutamine-hydrolysing)
VIERLLCLEESWAASLDRFYLLERMQRWAGNGIDSLLNRRTYLCPFFESEFVESAIGLSPALKINSRAAHAAVALLDPELAQIPLDSGVAPAAMASSGLRTRITELGLLFDKSRKRFARVAARQRSSTLGSTSAAGLWYRHRLFEKLPIAGLVSTGLFDREGLSKICNGEYLPDRPTLGFVLMMSELVEPE